MQIMKISWKLVQSNSTHVIQAINLTSFLMTSLPKASSFLRIRNIKLFLCPCENIQVVSSLTHFHAVSILFNRMVVWGMFRHPYQSENNYSLSQRRD